MYWNFVLSRLSPKSENRLIETWDVLKSIEVANSSTGGQD